MHVNFGNKGRRPAVVGASRELTLIIDSGLKESLIQKSYQLNALSFGGGFVGFVQVKEISLSIFLFLRIIIHKIILCVTFHPIFWELTIDVIFESRSQAAREMTNLAIAEQRGEGVWRNSLGTHGKRMRCLKYRVHAETFGQIGTHARKKKVVQEYIFQNLT